MDFNRRWTAFALEAEADAHGFAGIADAHNRIKQELVREVSRRLQEIDNLHAELAKVQEAVNG